VELAGSAPQNVRWSDAGKKRSQAVDRRAAGCNLLGVVLKSALPQANCKIQTPFSATPVRAFQGACVLVWRCDARHFILNEAVRNSTLALH
jgi:hypothetical protein